MDMERQKAKWKARRRMAWISFVAIIVIAIVAFAKPDAASQAAGVIGTVVTLLGAIVLGYLGFSTWDDVRTQQSSARGIER